MKVKIKKIALRIAAGLTAAVMLTAYAPEKGVFSSLTAVAYANNTVSVSYISRQWNNDTVTETTKTANCEVIAENAENHSDLVNNWYVVNSNVTINDLTISGEANLILSDGCSLTCTKGVKMLNGSTLNIYGQSGNSGKLICAAEEYKAGIGGEGNININIHGGSITSEGNLYGAAIGGNDEVGNVNVTILGGVVNARGRRGGAAIGGGCGSDMSGSIFIRGGEVNACYEDKETEQLVMAGAAIGAGSESRYWGTNGHFTGTVEITGGTVTAKSVGHNITAGAYSGAGIGAGHGGDMKGEIKISGANTNVYACSKYGGAAIGAGREENSPSSGGGECTGTITIDDNAKVTAGLEKLSYGNGQFIGHGNEGDESGTLSLYAGASVKYGESDQTGDLDKAKTNATYVSASERINACRNEALWRDFKYLEIAPCTLHEESENCTYEIKNSDSNKHIKKCKYCITWTEEEHSGTTCVCGANGITYKVRITGDLPRECEVAAGKEFVFPEHDEISIGSSIPASYSRFKCYKVGDKEYQPGDIIKVESNIEVSIISEDVYKINKVDASNGSFTVDKEYAAAGETVTVDVTPNHGYEVESVKYDNTIIAEKDIKITNTQTNEVITKKGYQFSLDAIPTTNEVTVTVTFKQKDLKSAEQVQNLGNGYYYTYGTDTDDKDKVYIIYIYNGDTAAADYIAVQTLDGETWENIGDKLDTVYKKIRFPDESVLDIENLASDKYFVAIVLDNAEKFVPNTEKFQFVPSKEVQE